ncbi:MAG: DUF2116 family Zn-ribbon domain-containing protein [Bacteroidales bacterium]|nr:DUF2116 family Zn-ribbon domain-containing protein [Bacteroidales bacterium]
MDNTCPECGDKILGRSDKKFCSDHCRNSYNNRKNKDTAKLLRDVNSILLKNHRILKDLWLAGIENIQRDKLLLKGFNFDFFTNMQVSGDEKTCYYCYDYGVSKIEGDIYTLLKREEVLEY